MNVKMNSFNKKEYDEKNRMRISLFLSYKNDKDIIDAIDPKNIQGSIKKLIRKSL